MTETIRAGSFSGLKIARRSLVLAVLLFLPLAGGLLLASQSADPQSSIAICQVSATDTSSATIPYGPRDAERAFIAENEIVMRRMMAAMAISPTGDVDRDFVSMMGAHHQGAIEMAIAELRHGRNEQLRRIAQEIVVTQGQEIYAMRSAVIPTYSAPVQQGPPAAPGDVRAAFDSENVPTIGTAEGIRQ